VACGAKKPQRELLRVASCGGSTPVVDVSRKVKGRGAYLCFDVACVEKALKRRSFERALKLKNPAPPELKLTLQTALNDMIVGTTEKIRQSDKREIMNSQ
jgi:predicted RNA-binding protein YlxR (DUF448 family)